MHVAWDKEEARLVLFVKVSLAGQPVPRGTFAAAAAQFTTNRCNGFVI